METSVMKSEYQQELYDALPQVGQAFQKLAIRGALPLIDTTVRQIFMAHGVENVFGVRLLHRHFDLDRKERMVQFGSVASPWTESVIARAAKTGIVQPSNWLFQNGVAYPYEYRYLDTNPQDLLPDELDYTEFLVDYARFLSENDLMDTLGLVLCEGNSQRSINEICLPMERVAINYPAEKDLSIRSSSLSQEELEGEFTVPAAWFFFQDPVAHSCGKAFHVYTHVSRHPNLAVFYLDLK
ncbi:hypothetical protein FHETE_4162 [Fusarium heterosporum]|uniref:Uncharacterized protein n=1 Tax=Fusarium heterosporum TaxID=42747 RepID=A0A8H5WUX0_FUSHE|nr:hypothetical protein FHETE_4162 [Fusarium heterosporum]